MLNVSKDFEEFFELLNRNKVTYLVVGGYAYAIYAEPRYTKDVDLFFERSEENASRLLKSIHEFGFESLDLKVSDFTKQGQVIQLGTEPLRIDLLNEIEGIKFKQAWDNKIKSRYGMQPIFVISKKDLIQNKKSTGRRQDEIDAENLEEY